MKSSAPGPIGGPAKPQNAIPDAAVDIEIRVSGISTVGLQGSIESGVVCQLRGNEATVVVCLTVTYAAGRIGI